MRNWSGAQWMMIDLLLAMLIIFIAQAEPPPKPAASATPKPGALMIELYWDMACDCDVDLWAQAPGDQPVGYSAKTGHILSLLRDDLGRTSSVDSRNYEIVQSFGDHAGSYIANAMLYRFRSGPKPVHVKVVISERMPDGSQNILITREAELANDGQEITLVRWDMDAHGNVIAGSINTIPKMIRAAA